MNPIPSPDPNQTQALQMSLKEATLSRTPNTSPTESLTCSGDPHLHDDDVFSCRNKK